MVNLEVEVKIQEVDLGILTDSFMKSSAQCTTLVENI